MEFKFSYLLILTTIIASVWGHPTIYPDIYRNETCYNPEPAKVLSFHFHLLYWPSLEEHKLGAYEIRDRFMETFKSDLRPHCDDFFQNDYLCMFTPENGPADPFLTAQWGVYIPVEDFFRIITWIMQHRGNYDIFVHPNTGCQVEDHSWWSFWGGQPWELNFHKFKNDYPFPWPWKKKQEILEDQSASELGKLFLKEHEK